MSNQPRLVQRSHNEHSHQMTVATPRTDRREMYIPSGTIVADKPRNMRLPFPFLRTWIMSLLALIALPVGIMLVLIGITITDSGQSDWVEQTATVTGVQDSAVLYRWNVSGKNYDTASGLDWDRIVQPSASGMISLSLGVCDLVSWAVIPQEFGATFPLWVNPQNPLEVQCVPVSQESAGVMLLVGGTLIVLAVIRLLRTIGAAAMASTRA